MTTRRLLPLLAAGTLLLTGCGTAPEDLTKEERTLIDSECMGAANGDVYEVWGYGGDWTTYGEWELEKAGDGFKTSGSFDSDQTGPIPVSCEVTYPEAEVVSHEVGSPEIDFKAAAIDACHQSVLDKSRYPADVEIVSTEVSDNVTVGPGGTRQFGVSGDVDLPNAFGAKNRQGYLCAGVLLNADGSTKYASALMNEAFRSRQ